MAEQSELGEDLRQALAVRGCALDSAQARRLALALLDLVRADLLVPDYDDAPPRGPHVYNRGNPQGAGTDNDGSGLWYKTTGLITSSTVAKEIAKR